MENNQTILKALRQLCSSVASRDFRLSDVCQAEYSAIHAGDNPASSSCGRLMLDAAIDVSSYA